MGSGMLRAGEWNNQGWQELSAEGVVPIPAILQQIDASHIQKVCGWGVCMVYGRGGLVAHVGLRIRVHTMHI